MKVSIITATFNSAATLRDAFSSVFDQDYRDLEYIVVDGGSKDETVQLINDNATSIANWISEKDQGIYDALNKGIRMATGDVIGFMHSDDLFAAPDSVSHIVEAFRRSAADAVYSDLHYVDKVDTGRVVRNWRSSPYREGMFERGWMPAHPTFYLKRSVYEAYGLYDTAYKISADYELMLRMLKKHKIKSYYLPEVTVKMRVGGESNASLGNRLKANREDVLAWKKNGLKMPTYTRWLKPLSKLLQFV